MHRFIIVLAALTCLMNKTVSGQGSRSIENVGIGSITIIEMGNNGDIWAGSASQGVGFYNGTTHSWTYFNRGNTAKLLSDSVTSLTFGLVGGVQHAYIGTTKGLADIKAGVLDTIAVPLSRRISGLSLVNSDTLWVATDSGLVAFDTFNHIIDTIPALANDYITTSQRGGTRCAGVAVGTANHGVYYTKDYTTFTVIDTSVPNFKLVDNRVNTIYKENSCNRYVIGTKGGLSLCPEGVPCQNFTTANGLPQNDVTAIGLDCHGLIWIGMRDSGVAIFNNPGFTRITTGNGLSDNRVTSISFAGGDCAGHIATVDGNIAIVDSNKVVVQILNGIADITSDKITVSVYPQPASDKVTFLLDKELTGGEIMLSDLSGRIVQQLSIDNKTNGTIDVSALPQGLYFYRVVSGGQLLMSGKVQVVRD